MEEKLKAGDGAGTRKLSTENVAGPGIASLQALAGGGDHLKGDLYFDVRTMRTLYATDASAYRGDAAEAVAIPPKTIEDIQTLIVFARKEKTSLIPRAAGTSLAGQVVGKGIIVDVSKYFTNILELNAEERWVRVQPGVIRDELNLFLKPHELLLFGARDVDAANRAMIGGMVGNNSCGSNLHRLPIDAGTLMVGSKNYSHGVTLNLPAAVFAGSQLEPGGVPCQMRGRKGLEGDVYRHECANCWSNLYDNPGLHPE